MMGSSVHDGAPSSRTAIRATSALNSVTYIERRAANGPLCMARSKLTSRVIRSRSRILDGDGCRAALRERDGKRHGLGVEHHILQIDHRAFIDLDGAKEKRRAVGAPSKMRGGQRPNAPIAIGRIQHEDLLGTVIPPNPELNKVQISLGAIPDPDRHIARAPKVGEREPGQPHVHALIERDLVRGRRGRGFGRQGSARRPIGFPFVVAQAAHIRRVPGFDAEIAHRRRREVDRNVVFLRAQDRLRWCSSHPRPFRRETRPKWWSTRGEVRKARGRSGAYDPSSRCRLAGRVPRRMERYPAIPCPSRPQPGSRKRLLSPCPSPLLLRPDRFSRTTRWFSATSGAWCMMASGPIRMRALRSARSAAGAAALC